MSFCRNSHPQNPASYFSKAISQERAVTLLELLVVVATVLVLGCLAYGAYQSGQKSARQASEIAALRRITQGYLMATSENNGIFPLGFDQVSRIEDLDFQFPDGTSLLSKAGNISVVVQRLPWRLAPYLDWDIERSFITWANRKTFQQNPSGHYYALSIAPAFGLNAFCVGGYGGSSESPDLAKRLTQVSQPSKLIVFTSSTVFYVKPPNMAKSVFDTQNPGWKQQSDIAKPTPKESDQYGNILFNYDGYALVSFIDGHTEIMSANNMRDSRLWSREALERNEPGRAIQR